MTFAAPDYEPSAVGPLTEILESYGQCLELSREYVAVHSDLPEEDDFDIDLLQDFINARADLFSVAETSFSALSACLPDTGEDPARRELTQKVVGLLEEMTEVEDQLSSFLGDRLEKMRSTILQMREAQPVFKRYGHLGGNKIAPNRINRHG
jgi:hypothetical protein